MMVNIFFNTIVGLKITFLVKIVNKKSPLQLQKGFILKLNTRYSSDTTKVIDCL